ncbi:MAG: glycosyltransferase family 9 protein [Halanaerobium sp.]|nr:glycosyltransferase family 9 protein [Halanaerobium sp.]
MSGVYLRRKEVNINRVLLIILAPLGDTLFTTPAIRALRERYSRAEITALVWDSNHEMLKGNPDINHLVVCPESWKLPQIISSLHEQEFDLAVGLSNLGSFILPFCPAEYKIGFKSRSLGIFYDEDVPDDRNIHAIDYCLGIVEAVGARTNNHVPRFYYQEEDRELAADYLAQHGFQPGNFVAIHPGGKFFTRKRWPLKNYSELIRAFGEEMHLPVIIIGGPGDWGLAEEIIQRGGVGLNAAGQLGIKETGALLHMARLFVGNDSAPLHIASALGVHSIGLFGPTDPDNFAPRGKNAHIIRKKLFCNPCFRWLGMPWQYFPTLHRDCDGNCMEVITVDDVMNKASQILKGSGNLEDRVFFG